VDGLLVSLLGLLPLHCRIGPDAKLGDPIRPSGAVFIAWAGHWAGKSRHIPACFAGKVRQIVRSTREIKAFCRDLAHLIGA
jgi:hypothetical protein